MLSLSSSQAHLLQALKGQVVNPPPIWLMRQAGRYLPEYREVRKRVPRFLDLCFNPALAAEVTIQPLRRFDLDAAIIFSDILVVPHALGQRVEFIEGEGPRLDSVATVADLAKLDRTKVPSVLSPVYEAIERVRADLAPHVALIGFCGAPWTVATYMVGGGSSKDHAQTRLWAYRDPASFQRLIDLLVDVSAEYLLGQVRAGANALQIFDSWAGSLPEDEFARWCIAPAKAIIQRVKAQAPHIPVIGFPRGCGALAENYAKTTGVDAVSCDTSMELAWIRDRLQNLVAVQGNLDPLLLLAGGRHFDERAHEIVSALNSGPFIFNLGHGIQPETPIAHVERLVHLVKTGET
jgi:uroporphyrinogen decarboxylase